MPPVPVSGVPWPVLRAVGVAVPFAREIVGVRHQFDQEFVIDATATTETLGVAPTPWDDVVLRRGGTDCRAVSTRIPWSAWVCSLPGCSSPSLRWPRSAARCPHGA
ncbi:MAG: NAD-dependent epimerase/dehydratase [Modestobacter sp.]|nr:NAD-dependent epimerase/dehydratase [Modestobacter sp.]